MLNLSHICHYNKHPQLCCFPSSALNPDIIILFFITALVFYF